MGRTGGLSEHSRALLPTLALALVAGSLAAQEPARPGTPGDVRHAWIDPFDADRFVRVVTAEEIWRSNARNLPELLRQEFGLWMTFANYAGGGPIDRGVAGNGLLIVLDGIKINNTAYRFGDLEYLSTIDLHTLERIEIVDGAAGPYAGDTAGPVIRLFTKRDAAPLAPGGNAVADPVARALYRYATVDKSSVARLEAHQETDRYAFQFGLSTRDIGDLKGGGDVGFQRVSGYEEASGDALIQYFISDTQTFEVGAQILEQQNVPQFDRVAGGSHLDFELDPRKRALFKLSYLDATPRSWSDRLEASFYLHQQRQRAFEQLTSTPEKRRQTSDNNDVLGLQVHSRLTLGENHHLRYGVELTEEEIGAVRREVDTLTGEELVRGTDPSRGGQGRDQRTLFVEDRIEVHSEVVLRVGARYSSFSVSGTQLTPAGSFDLDADDDGVSGYLSLLWSPRDDLRLFASYDRGFLLPGIDEVTGHTGLEELASLPNSDLTAETVDAWEFGARYRNDWLEIAAALWHKELSDIPLLLPTTVDGSPFADGDGDGLQDPGEPLWVQTQSIGEAEIDGLDLTLEIFLPWDLTLFASLSATEGDDPRSGAPLSGIPPDYSAFGMRWQSAWKWEPWVEALVRTAGDKTRLGPTEELDPTLDPLSLASYDVLTVRAGITLPPRLRLAVSLENPSDEAYKPYGSFLYAPGRSLALTAEYSF